MCRAQGAGFRVQGAGIRVQDSECRVQGAWFRPQGAGCRFQGSGLNSRMHIIRLELGRRFFKRVRTRVAIL